MTHKSEITGDETNHRSLIRCHNRNRVILDPNLTERNYPDDGDEEECNERRYLEFYVVGKVDEPEGKDENECHLR
jgi:hypothetical protein